MSNNRNEKPQSAFGAGVEAGGELERSLAYGQALLGQVDDYACLYLIDGQYMFAYVSKQSGGISYSPEVFGNQTQKQGRKTTVKFLSPESVRTAFSFSVVDTGWLPPNTLRWGAGRLGPWVAMWIPPATYTLNLSPISRGRDVRPGAVNPPVGNESRFALPVKLSLPGFVFAGAANVYSVWALKEPEFSHKAAAYHAPLPNVYLDGKICWGNNSIVPARADAMEQQWRLFIESPFNSDLDSNKSKSRPDSILQKLWELALGIGSSGDTAETQARPKRKAKQAPTIGGAYPVDDLQPVVSYNGLVGGAGVPIGEVLTKFADRYASGNAGYY